MNRHCPTCAAPLPVDVHLPMLGVVTFCTDACVAAWIADGRHVQRVPANRWSS